MKHLFSQHTDTCVRCGISATDDAIENGPCLADKLHVLLVPTKAYQTIRETLECDSRAGNFDPKLRRQIHSALNAIREVTPVITIDVEGGVAEVAKCPDWIQVRIRDRDVAKHG